MREQRRKAISVSEDAPRALLAAAGGLALGILAEILFRGARPGLNVLLWILAAGGLAWALAHRAGAPLDRQVRWRSTGCAWRTLRLPSPRNRSGSSARMWPGTNSPGGKSTGRPSPQPAA